MSSISGTLSDNGQSVGLAIPRGETLGAVITVQGIDEFVGRVTLQRSTNGGASYETARNRINEEMTYEGTAMTPLTGQVMAETLKNDSNTQALYRILVEDYDGDAIDYEVTSNEGDPTEVILRDHNGVPVLRRTDDGFVQFECGIAVSEIRGQNIDGELQQVTIEDGVDLSHMEEDGITIVRSGVGFQELVKNLTIPAADIVDVTAGKFGHAAGQPIVDDPGADQIVELLSCLMRNDRAVAAYTAGGNITVNRNGGAAITGLVSAANSLGNAADTRTLFTPLAVAGEVAAANKGLNLVTSAAFTTAGAVGILRIRVRYIIHTLDLA